MNELLLKLLHRHDAHEELFDFYGSVLNDIYQGIAIENALRRFEKQLLSQTGYGLILEHEAGSAHPVVAERVYRYIPELGPRPLMNNGPGRLDREQGVNIKGKSLLDFSKENFDDRESLRECRKLVRYLLDRQLSGKPLHSREVFHQVLSNLT